MTTCPAPLQRLLYVEDDRVAALLFTEALRDVPGLCVEVAEDGAEALALATRWQPQVLVLDAHLPDTTGIALLDRLRALPGLRDVPAFICSADALQEDVQRSLAAGFAGYWIKPIQRSQVLADLGALSFPPPP